MEGKQISIFEMMGDVKTPVIPFEQQKKGRRGWILDISGIFLRKNGFQEDAIGVCTRPIILEADTKEDKYHRISQTWKTTYGPAMGSCGGETTIYASRPTWEECVEYAHKHYSIPQKVIYYERDGNFNNPVYDYEKGYKKER